MFAEKINSAWHYQEWAQNLKILISKIYKKMIDLVIYTNTVPSFAFEVFE